MGEWISSILSSDCQLIELPIQMLFSEKPYLVAKDNRDSWEILAMYQWDNTPSNSSVYF